VVAGGTDRRARAAGAHAQSGIPAVRTVRSESDGGENQTGGNRQLRAALLLSATVRSPELMQARARVAPGSPELGRGDEGATTNSMAGKRP
jgi:hypothetical protein